MSVEDIVIQGTYKESLKTSGMSDAEFKEKLVSIIQERDEVIAKYKLRDIDIFPIRMMRSQAFIFISLLSLVLLTLYIAHSNLTSIGIPENITYITIGTLELCSLTFLANNKKYPNYIFILLTLVSSGLYFKTWEYGGVSAAVRCFYTITPSMAMFFLSKLIFEKYERDRNS